MKEKTVKIPFQLRIPEDLKNKAETKADSLGISLNALILMALNNFIKENT